MQGPGFIPHAARQKDEVELAQGGPYLSDSGGLASVVPAPGVRNPLSGSQGTLPIPLRVSSCPLSCPSLSP